MLIFSRSYGASVSHPIGAGPAAKDGDMQMTYTAEPDEKSKYAWLVFGWAKTE
ncbi:hypothetical protein NKH57_24095 [Mesorhizobium sp. M1050]|uniref:hypothetical protein n=1 Tax=unclassified Mesorhizobium TaxID=325217 RepID=UPI0003CEDF8B|nr:hypothetical protein [Mesorhizobium sp. LNHC252B00]ESY70170.1 hypothetical protein X743_23445 [Mesorhizobium sp. LNHC252B00]